ncbi:MAG: exosortase-associated EpsI family protein [Pirellulales bacterium]
MLRFLPALLAVALIVFLAIVQGLWSDRWAKSNIDAREFAARLGEVPMQIGTWQGEDQAQDERVLRSAGAVGSVSRVYTNTRTSEQVSAFIVCGHSRDVAGHTPEECYPGAGFTQEGPSRKRNIETDDQVAQFYTTTFRKESPEGVQRLRIYWAWSRTPGWEAPNSARIEYAGERALYKVYLIHDIARSRDTEADNPSINFARIFLPEVTQRLYGDQAAGAEASGDVPAESSAEPAEAPAA